MVGDFYTANSSDWFVGNGTAQVSLTLTPTFNMREHRNGNEVDTNQLRW